MEGKIEELRYRLQFASERLKKDGLTKDERRAWQTEYNNCMSRLEKMEKSA